MTKPGEFFERLTGRSAASCQTLAEVDRVVESVFTRPLLVKTLKSSLVAEHGNVFPFSDDVGDLDRQIDKELARMGWCTDERKDI